VIDSLLPNNIKAELAGKGYAAQPYQRTPDSAIGFFLRGQASGNDQAVHTATDIPISAFSSGSEVWRQFVGVHTNTDVFFKLARAASGGREHWFW
jgi:alkaline phosphatase